MNRSGLARILVLGFFLTYMLLPLIATVAFSFSVRWDRTILPEGVTLDWWKAVIERRAFLLTLRNSILISVGAMVFSVLLVTPTAYWAHLRVPQAKPLIELFTVIPFGIPGVVLALALLRSYARLGPTIVYSPWMLIAACMVLALPFMYRPVANALASLNVRALTEAAQMLGANWTTTLTRVIAPNIMSGVLGGALLVFSTVFVEFTLANLLVGARFKTFPIYMVEFTRFDARQASALAAISFVVAWLTSLAIIWVAGGASRGRESLGPR